MKQNKHFMAIAIAALFFISCQKNRETATTNKALPTEELQGKGSPGNVFTLSNQTSGNAVLAYSRSADGSLSYANAYPTGGTGTGTGLGNQGAVILSEDNNWLLAVNAGSNSISSFQVSGNGLQLKSTVSSGGTTPVSITLHDGVVYVLNSGGTGNIHGFNLHADGSLHAIVGSSRALSSAAAGAAQISFVADGDVVAITEKATNKIISYAINAQGIPGMMHSLTSFHPTPFGFAVGKNDINYVSEAAGGAPNASGVSSYHIGSNGVITLVDGPNLTGESAACWVVTTNNGKYVYSTNTNSNTISSFYTDHSGMLDVLQAVAASTGTGSTPIDAALSNNSKFMYVLNSGNVSIGVFAVAHDGSLSHLQNVTGLPVGANGLAAK